MTDDSSIFLQRNGIVCKVRTQDPENFDEEVKSLLTACWIPPVLSLNVEAESDCQAVIKGPIKDLFILLLYSLETKVHEPGILFY